MKNLKNANIKIQFGLLFILLLLVSCAPRQQRTPLVLISIDGFKPVYLEQHETPNLDRLSQSGVLAKGMTPVFPSKTFPNHYSLVTGLYTEHTGLIANTMYDPTTDRWFSLGRREAVTDSSWYGGEPIWVTAEMQGVHTSPLFWPGSEAAMKGVRPTHWLPFNNEMPFEARIDSIISWLTAPEETRSYFATMYFSIVDDYGHKDGPENLDSMAIAVRAVDDAVGYLLSKLEEAGLWPNVNILVVSDHGMAQTSDDRVILLDKIIAMDDVQMVDWNPVAVMNPKEGKLDKVYNALKKAESHYTVYKKEEIPEHYRVKNTERMPAILLLADVGYSITTSERFKTRSVAGGNHGYDNSSPEMQALFLASGPAFKQGAVIDPFQNIHVYEMMCRVLNLKPAPNDGHPDSLKHVLQ